MTTSSTTNSATVDGYVWSEDEAGAPKRYRVRSEIYRDPAVFEQEMEHIFESTWVYLCHESEISEPGDYRTVQVGRQPVIVTRGKDGVVRGLLNACRHRGSVVCRAQFGNANLFRCPYHGWTYNNTGALTGIPQRRQGYDLDFGRNEDLGLVPITRCESYRGLVFGAINDPGNSLVDHFGQARKYVDLWADRSIGGEVTAVYPPHAYSYPGNWKMQAENGADGYHGNYTHDSYFELLDILAENDLAATRKFREAGCTRAFDNGHGLLERPGPRSGNPVDAASHGPAFERYFAALAAEYGEAHADLILTQRNLLLFPNVYLFDRSIRVIVPRAVDHTDVYVYFTRLEGVEEEVNERRLSEHQRFFGTAGFGTPDDIDVFVGVQGGVNARGMTWCVLERGLAEEKVSDDGERVGHSTGESPQRAIYRQWSKLMPARPLEGGRDAERGRGDRSAHG